MNVVYDWILFKGKDLFLEVLLVVPEFLEIKKT